MVYLYLGELQYFACWAILVGGIWNYAHKNSHPGDKTCSFKLDHHPKFNDTSVCTFQFVAICNSQQLWGSNTQASIRWESYHPIPSIPTAQEQHRWLLPVSICICCRAAIIMACAKPRRVLMQQLEPDKFTNLIIYIYGLTKLDTMISYVYMALQKQ